MKDKLFNLGVIKIHYFFLLIFQFLLPKPDEGGIGNNIGKVPTYSVSVSLTNISQKLP